MNLVSFESYIMCKVLPTEQRYIIFKPVVFIFYKPKFLKHASNQNKIFLKIESDLIIRLNNIFKALIEFHAVYIKIMSFFSYQIL